MKKLHFKDVTSTNDMAKSLVKVGEFDIMITADFQSQGRMKPGADWYGQREKDCHLSFTLPCPKADKIDLYLKIACISVRRVLKKYGISADIKAPNDILVKGKKISSVLCEAEFFEKKAYIIVGVGINVFSKDFPKWLNATSMIKELEKLDLNLQEFGEEITLEARKIYKEEPNKIIEEFNKFALAN
ncbi:MAG: biotin--[Abditibacteriota bacterium]|nr:biotin--[acetyl-CoA-carboxylase] ligase [Abditibacteriota bacterium]